MTTPAAEASAEGDGEPSQLADEYPQIGHPLRMQAPSTSKTPERRKMPSRDEQLRLSTFSSQARARAAARGAPLPTANRGEAGSKTAIADATLLAFSSQRAGKAEAEGHAHLAMAITHDNVEQFPAVVPCPFLAQDLSRGTRPLPCGFAVQFMRRRRKFAPPFEATLAAHYCWDQQHGREDFPFERSKDSPSRSSSSHQTSLVLAVCSRHRRLTGTESISSSVPKSETGAVKPLL